MLRSTQPLKVINFIGAPGMGKSSLACLLYARMKMEHMSVELCREYAKYLVIAKREWQLLEEQLYLLAKQHHELFILRGQFEYAITDSPLILTSFYSNKDLTPASFETTVDEYNATFDNIYFFVRRAIDDSGIIFENRGRRHNRCESLALEASMLKWLELKNVRYFTLNLDDGFEPAIKKLDFVLNAISKNWPSA